MKWRALVIDDEQSIAATTAAILEMNGFATEIAFSAQQATKLLAAAAYDLVISDMKMETDTAGFDVSEFASKLPTRPVIIIISAYATLSADWQVRGVNAFFQKPTNTADLLSTIDRLLAERVLGREMAA